jgi:hypothetical protein
MDYDSNANRLLSNKSSAASIAILSINVASNTSGTLVNNALTASPTAFRASPFATNSWLVGLANGGLVKLTNVTNLSATFTTINNPFVGAVSAVRFGETENDLIVTIHNYGVISIWSSSNGGNSWSSKEGDLPNIPVRDFLLNPLETNEAIIATQLGVWSTDNFNDTNPNWSQSYNGMSDVSVTSLDYWNVSGDNIDNKIMTRGCKKFTEIMRMSTEGKRIQTHKSVNLHDFIDRFCHKLSLSDGDKKHINNLAKLCEELNLINDNTPPAMASGCIFLYIRIHNIDIDKKNISEVCKISEVTINKCYKKLEENEKLTEILQSKYNFTR